jgi:hypothetical protein
MVLFTACYPPPVSFPQLPQMPSLPQVPVPQIPFMSWFYGPFSFLMWICMLAVYFVPTIIVLARRGRHLVLVVLLNIFLGWTFVGWIVAFILALL